MRCVGECANVSASCVVGNCESEMKTSKGVMACVGGCSGVAGT